MLYYSKSFLPHALGFWQPGSTNKSIPPFKFKQNLGRSLLQSDCASGVKGRKNYYSGWCQFWRLARVSGGILTIFEKKDPTRPGLEVDLYAFTDSGARTQTQLLPNDTPLNTMDSTAIACLPKRADFFEDNVSINLNHWMTKASAIGAATRFDKQI